MIGSNQTLAASNVVKPTHKSAAVWIDANDYAVGTFANGAVITNKGNNGATFDVSGATLEVQLDGNGIKEFEFNGSYIRCTAGGSSFTQYHHTNSGFNYQIYFIGKLGATSNPDAFFPICGNNGGSSANIGITIWLDNRVATAAASRGIIQFVTNGTSGQPVYDSRFNNGLYNVDQSVFITMVASALIDQNYCIQNADIISIVDVQRSTATTTSGLGTARNSNGAAASQTFNIGAFGNGGSPLATGSTMKQFIIFDELLNQYESRGVDAYFGLYPARGNTTIRSGGATVRLVADQYILGGVYAKNADRSKTVLVASRGTDHFAVGTDRDGVQVMSTDDATTWPTSFSSVFTDATKTVMPPYGGYNTGTGTLIAFYGKWTTATGVYTDLIARRSTDGGTTWGSEITITLPVTSPVLTAWLPHDQLMICNNGDIMMPMYALSGTSLYKMYVMRSTDDGLTFTFTEIYTSPTAYVAEPSGCYLGGNNHIVSGRIEVAAGGIFKYKLILSADDGVTWPISGDTSFGGALFAHPPMLRSFLIDGTLVVEFSWVNRLTRRWHMKYATAADVISTGPTVFDSKVTYTVFERLQGNNTGWATGYPFFIHSRNDLNMQGAWFEETSASTTRVGFQYFNDEIRTAIKTELGL